MHWKYKPPIATRLWKSIYQLKTIMCEVISVTSEYHYRHYRWLRFIHKRGENADRKESKVLWLFLPGDNRIIEDALSARKPTAPLPPPHPNFNSVKTQKCQTNSNIDPLVRNKQTAGAAAAGGRGPCIDFQGKEKKGGLRNELGHEPRHKYWILNVNALTCNQRENWDTPAPGFPPGFVNSWLGWH